MLATLKSRVELVLNSIFNADNGITLSRPLVIFTTMVSPPPCEYESKISTLNITNACVPAIPGDVSSGRIVYDELKYRASIEDGI